MGWTEVWQYSKLVKCPLENQYFASYIAIAAVYFDRICILFSIDNRIVYYLLQPQCLKPKISHLEKDKGKSPIQR